ncbi:hypothetical protein BMS3Abin16_00671 [archaeon BMS3Abin16]|nr:hypothetical protein BMS3Abin16_00671 [archaeon BMS3Abin16]
MSVRAPDAIGFISPIPRGRTTVSDSRLLPGGGEKSAENTCSPSIVERNSSVSNSTYTEALLPG